MHPKLEKITPNFGSSFTYRKFAEGCSNSQPYWHFHPEMELVYVVSGSGKRHIGHHISYYKEGDLIFLGSNVPHLGFTDRLQGNPEEVVVQMLPNFLGKHFLARPETNAIEQLFQRAKHGISFYGTTKKEVGKQLLKMSTLQPFERLLAFLQCLQLLAQSKEYELLNVESYGLDINFQDHERMNHIYQYVQAHFQRSITLEEIAQESNMTIPAFCRYFKKLTHKTFTQFVNEFRVFHARQLLTEEKMSIAEICFACGFNNLSNFNKHFKTITGENPTTYRKSLREVLE